MRGAAPPENVFWYVLEPEHTFWNDGALGKRKPGGRLNTLCKGCGRSWSGYAECHCTKCHRHFSNVEGFDIHLIGNDERMTHRDPPALGPKGGRGFVEVERASGSVWVKPIEEEALQKLRRTRTPLPEAA